MTACAERLAASSLQQILDLAVLCSLLCSHFAQRRSWPFLSIGFFLFHCIFFETSVAHQWWSCTEIFSASSQGLAKKRLQNT